jgi:hypothetical protein
MVSRCISHMASRCISHMCISHIRRWRILYDGVSRRRWRILRKMAYLEEDGVSCMVSSGRWHMASSMASSMASRCISHARSLMWYRVWYLEVEVHATCATCYVLYCLEIHLCLCTIYAIDLCFCTVYAHDASRATFTCNKVRQHVTR